MKHVVLTRCSSPTDHQSVFQSLTRKEQEKVEELTRLLLGARDIVMGGYRSEKEDLSYDPEYPHYREQAIRTVLHYRHL